MNYHETRHSYDRLIEADHLGTKCAGRGGCSIAINDNTTCTNN